MIRDEAFGFKKENKKNYLAGFRDSWARILGYRLYCLKITVYRRQVFVAHVAERPPWHDGGLDYTAFSEALDELLERPVGYNSEFGVGRDVWGAEHHCWVHFGDQLEASTIKRTGIIAGFEVSGGMATTTVGYMLYQVLSILYCRPMWH